jgi:YHS domain-containing protein
MTSPIAQQSKPFGAGQERMALATPQVPSAAPAGAPQLLGNPATGYGAQPATTPSPAMAAPALAAPASAAPVTPVIPPKQVNNPYLGLGIGQPAVQQPAQQQPIAAAVTPAQRSPIGYDKSPLQAAGAAAVPPMVPSASAAPMGPPVASGAPDPRQLPPGAPPLGFDGYCPVSMRNSWKWVPGDPRWGVVHRGHTYWFATAEEQKQFWTDPDRYTPALSGNDPVLALDHKQQVPGKREHSLDYDGLFYMFASEATLQQFTANPQRYSTGVRQAMGIPRGRLVK